ncbi:MAG: DUF2177 family protein [Phreatobacter sp.]
MQRFAIAYAASTVTLLALDAVWLRFATRLLYRPQLGALLSDNPNLTIAALFYLVYVVGIVVFAVLPGAEARSLPLALGLGALLGLVAYGTYDITNLATLKGWTTMVAVIDIAWGVVVSALSAAAGCLMLRLFAPT